MKILLAISRRSANNVPDRQRAAARRSTSDHRNYVHSLDRTWWRSWPKTSTLRIWIGPNGECGKRTQSEPPWGKGRAVETHGTWPIGHNGLWGLTTAKYKDVVLVGEMDIRSQGSSPHRLALHLCGGDGVRSPDHWVEIDMVDLGDKARFSPMAALRSA